MTICSQIITWTYYIAQSGASAKLDSSFTLFAKGTGQFTVSKTVSGDGADRDKPFAFIVFVTLGGKPVADGKYGDLSLENGAAKWTLKNGDSVTVSGLPAGAQYAVCEDSYAADGYTCSVNGTAGSVYSGTLTAGSKQKIAFLNTRGTSDAPKTGDRTLPGFWLAVQLLSGGALALCLMRRKKRSANRT